MNTEALLAEYKELKQEQRMRMTSRDNLGYWIFPALAVVGGVALSGPGREPLLLLLPLVCIALGWAYLGNDTKVTQIGDYIRTELAPIVREAGEPMPFGWETYHRATPLRAMAKRIHPVIQLMIFCAPAWAALTVFVASSAGVTMWVPVAVLEAALVGALTLLFIAHGWPRVPAIHSERLA
jgi:hypothetical protein